MNGQTEGVGSSHVIAVVFRQGADKPEFCLVSPENDGRWEFLIERISDGESAFTAAVRGVALGLLLTAQADSQELDCFRFGRSGSPAVAAAVLVKVECAPAGQPTLRSRWCLAEEARARIRRKPIRRLIDLALRRIAELDRIAPL